MYLFTKWRKSLLSSLWIYWKILSHCFLKSSWTVSKNCCNILEGGKKSGTDCVSFESDFSLPPSWWKRQVRVILCAHALVPSLSARAGSLFWRGHLWMPEALWYSVKASTLNIKTHVGAFLCRIPHMPTGLDLEILIHCNVGGNLH